MNIYLKFCTKNIKRYYFEKKNLKRYNILRNGVITWDFCKKKIDNETWDFTWTLEMTLSILENMCRVEMDFKKDYVDRRGIVYCFR